MADSRILPGARVPIVGPGGTCTAEFYRFFQRLTPSDDLSSLSGRVSELEEKIGEGGAYLLSSTKVLSGEGIAVDGILSQGAVTISLEDIEQQVGGTLQRFAVDGKGRVVQTATATTDDLPEGSTNLYFTNERAQDAVGNALVDTPRIDLTYDDAANTISADLVVVPNGGGGTMWRFTVNSYGQVTGRTAATTDDLPEGVNNLYFSKSRVAGSLVAGGGITLSVDGSGNTSIATTAQAGGMDLTDWTNVALTDWSNVQLSDWTSQAVFSFNGRKGDVLPAADDYQTNQIKPSEYTLLTLPSASTNKGRHVYCTNLVEGYAPVWSDGSNWRRFTDNSVAN